MTMEHQARRNSGAKREQPAGREDEDSLRHHIRPPPLALPNTGQLIPEGKFEGHGPASATSIRNHFKLSSHAASNWAGQSECDAFESVTLTDALSGTATEMMQEALLTVCSLGVVEGHGASQEVLF